MVRLLAGAAVACRVDVADDTRDARDWILLARTHRTGRADIAAAADDLGASAALAGKAAVVPDRDRELSWVVIPLVANQATLGSLRVALDGASGPSSAELAYLHHIASSLANGLASAELHEQSERISRRLQESLLPHALPSAAWFEVAARYVPATAGMHVGGDWYDAELVSADELAFSVGDVAGHGVEAAARMGELRSAMHAFRQLSRAPDELIALMHRLCEPPGYFATALCARLDPLGALRWASAGHLPPILARPDGVVAALPVNQSPPLGAGLEGTVRLNEWAVAAGDTVVLYTDGLIERRDEPLDVSLDRLAGQLGRLIEHGHGPGPGELLEAVVQSRQTSTPVRDDIAAIAVRLRAG